MSFNVSSPASQQYEFLGKGFSFPLKLTETGEVAQAIGLEHVSACVARLQLYCRGTYVGVTSLGGGISGETFKVNSMNRITILQRDCETVINTFEDRVSDVQMQVLRDANTPTELTISTLYIVDAVEKQEVTNIEVGE